MNSEIDDSNVRELGSTVLYKQNDNQTPLDAAIKYEEELAEINEENAIFYSRQHKHNPFEASLSETVENNFMRKARDCRQIAEWLKELKAYKEQDEVLKTISKMVVCKCNSNEVQAIDECLKSGEVLPTIIPHQKTGYWIRVDKDKLKCSECEVIHMIAQYPAGKIDWCPNCGSKMRKDKGWSE